MPLKYLFEAHFSDDTVLQQGPEDLSPTTDGKSAFYDVAQRLDEVVFFGLFDEDHEYAVDLEDGGFVLDGVSFRISLDPDVLLPPDAKYRLIYFRQHRVSFNADYEEVGHTITYHFGWQVTDTQGKNHQRVLVLD